MKPVMTMAVLLLALSSGPAWADESAKPKAKAAKPSAMSEEQRRDLERRIEALERKHEMQYRETDSPTGAPGAADTAPPTKPVTH